MGCLWRLDFRSLSVGWRVDVQRRWFVIIQRATTLLDDPLSESHRNFLAVLWLSDETCLAST